MCGIAGILTRVPVDPSPLDAILDALVHRGPDDMGWAVASATGGLTVGRGAVASTPTTMALGHRRLSIIDLTEGGWQPMRSPDGRWVLTYNGEVYNYVELRAELAGLGWDFRSTCDTEVVLAAWATWGPSALTRMTGMFAMCVADMRERKAYLARDHFGIKPLFVASIRDGLLFGSEVGALLRHPDVSREVDATRVYEYLRFGQVDHGDGTLLRGVRQLPAAHVMEVDLDGPVIGPASCYWALPEVTERSFANAVDAVRDAFERSVRIHLRADVPVGTALSGGIDSSAIVTMARKVGGADLPIHSFSYIADDTTLDESRWVQLAAQRAGALVTEVRVSSAGLRDELSDLIRSQGEPFGGTSIFAQRRVFAAARAAGVPVLLDGQGADELFGGYRSYMAAAFTEMVRGGHLLRAARLAKGTAGMPDVRISPRIALRVAATVLPQRLRAPLSRASGQESFPDWLNRAWFDERGVAADRRPPEALEQALARAFTDTSLPALLRYEDRNSMRYSVESRVPFLERELVELVFTIPRRHIIGPDGTSKWVFREAMRGLVPDPILDRRDKIGFTTPEAAWLASEAEWVSQVLERATAAPWYTASARARLVIGRQDGTAASHQLWRALNLALWAEVVGATA